MKVLSRRKGNNRPSPPYTVGEVPLGGWQAARAGAYFRRMPKNMRIFDVSSGCLSWEWALFETDDTEVSVEGAFEVAGDSSAEPEDTDIMIGRGKGAVWGGRRVLLSRATEMSRSVVVLSRPSRERRGRGDCWIRVSRCSR